MEIDLNQLPIPDWGLECPQCRYALFGLPSHRCPECGFHLNMQEIVKTWHRLRNPFYDGREDPLPDYGLDCEHCRRPLTGAIGRLCPHCDAPFDLQSRIPKRDWFLIDRGICGDLTVAALQAQLVAEYIPFTVVSGKTLTEIYGVANPFDVRLSSPREFYFDVLSLIRHARTNMEDSRNADAASWRCHGCRANVPHNFEICWRCGRSRDE